MKNAFMLRALALAMATVSFAYSADHAQADQAGVNHSDQQKPSNKRKRKNLKAKYKRPGAVRGGTGRLVNNSKKDVQVRFIFNDPSIPATDYQLLVAGKSISLPDLPDDKYNDPAEALVAVKGVGEADSSAHVSEWVEGSTYSITEQTTTHFLADAPDKDGGQAMLTNNAGEDVRYKFVSKGQHSDIVEYLVIAPAASVEIPAGEEIILRTRTATKGTDRSPSVVALQVGRNYQILPQNQKFQTSLFVHSDYVKKALANHSAHDSAAKKSKAPKRKPVDSKEAKKAKKAKQEKAKKAKKAKKQNNKKVNASVKQDNAKPEAGAQVAQ
jgi:hypothetical protein